MYMPTYNTASSMSLKMTWVGRLPPLPVHMCINPSFDHIQCTSSTHTHTHTHTHAHTRTHTHTHTHTSTHAHAHTCTRTRTRTHTHKRTHTHARTRARERAGPHVAGTAAVTFSLSRRSLRTRFRALQRRSIATRSRSNPIGERTSDLK